MSMGASQKIKKPRLTEGTLGISLKYMKKRVRALLLDPYVLALAAVMVLATSLSLIFFYGPSPINGADNYLYTDFGYYLSIGNFRQVAQWGVLAQQYILDAGIALFFVLLGPSRFSASLFGVLCFLLTIFVLYKMGTLLYNKKAGLLAAFFYSFMPVAVVNSSYVGDNGPMALFATLTVFFLAKAIKVRGKKQRTNYALSGFFGLIILLTTSQGVIILIVPAIVLLAYIIKNRNADSITNLLYFVGGLFAAFAIIAALGFAAGSNPLYIFTLNSQIYSTTSSPQTNFSTYINYLFPFSAVSNLNIIFSMMHTHSGIISILKYLKNWLFNASAFYYITWQTVGLSGYVVVLAAIYLFVRHRLSFWLPGLWLISTMLYLSYGTVSITRYIPIGYAYLRFVLLFMPAVALIIGMAAADILDFGKENARNKSINGTTKVVKYMLIAALAVITIVLFANSVLAIRYIELSQYNWVYNLLAIGRYVSTLPSNTIIYSNYPIFEYSGFSHIVNFIPSNCSYIEKGSYVVINYNESYASKCSLVEVLHPVVPEYLHKYDMFTIAAWGTYYNTTLYYRN